MISCRSGVLPCLPPALPRLTGHRFLAYAEHRSEILSTGTGFGGFGEFGYFGPSLGFSSSEVIDRTCETTFEVVNGRVENWSLRGNAC